MCFAAGLFQFRSPGGVCHGTCLELKWKLFEWVLPGVLSPSPSTGKSAARMLPKRRNQACLEDEKGRGEPKNGAAGACQPEREADLHHAGAAGFGEGREGEVVVIRSRISLSLVPPAW